MITSANRHQVKSTIQRLLSDAEYFSAFSMAGGFPASEAAGQVWKEMNSWANLKARDFDGQFKELAAILGYSVSPITSEEPIHNSIAAEAAE